jgi:hypothetical protein
VKFQGGFWMEDTKSFVDKLNENKKKAETNKKQHGSGHPEKKLPNKLHL